MQGIFKIGDLVIAKDSASQVMRVVADPLYAGVSSGANPYTDFYTCTWVRNGQQKVGLFSAAGLEQAEVKAAKPVLVF